MTQEAKAPLTDSTLVSEKRLSTNDVALNAAVRQRKVSDRVDL